MKGLHDCGLARGPRLRVVVHSPKEYPDPERDNRDIPASHEAQMITSKSVDSRFGLPDVVILSHFLFGLFGGSLFEKRFDFLFS